MRLLSLTCLVAALAFPVHALDRGAFTFTHYDLQVRVEPEQQRLAVRGKIDLRNDSGVPQKNFVLQISSTLNWRSIQCDGKPVQFLTHEYTSDIDHTGALSEAVVSVPRDVPPQGAVEVEVGYEGVVSLDATRLTRTGVAEEKAKQIDWDRVSRNFTAVRGIGYVTWYPVATEAANLSEQNSVEDVIDRWKGRESGAVVSLTLDSTSQQTVFFPGGTSLAKASQEGSLGSMAAFRLTLTDVDVPTFVLADYQKLTSSDSLTVYYLPGQEEPAKSYAEIASQVDPGIHTADATTSLQILALPDRDATSFVVHDVLITPLKSEMTNDAELSIVYARARQSVPSSRAWIREGLAHYAQVAFIEKQQGRQAALNYMASHGDALVELEKPAPEKTGDQDTKRSLVNAADGLYLQSKALYVWWMLNSICENRLSEIMSAYRAGDDNRPEYAQKLIERASRRDLQWFFDDWVYHDRGLPDFRIDSVFSTALEKGGFLVTITLENLGKAGAEVPITMKIAGGEIRRTIEIRAPGKASIRIESASAPQSVTVNDGSVPESDTSNNRYQMPLSDAPKQP